MIRNRYRTLLQKEPMVNIQRATNGKEEHVAVINCAGHKKSMKYLANLLKEHMNKSVNFLVADGACSGLLRLIELHYPWYVILFVDVFSVRLFCRRSLVGCCYCCCYFVFMPKPALIMYVPSTSIFAYCSSGMKSTSVGTDFYLLQLHVSQVHGRTHIAFSIYMLCSTFIRLKPPSIRPFLS